MRIAVVTATFPPAYWGGTGNVAYHNARLLSARGHQVTVFTSSVSGTVDCACRVVNLRSWFRIGNAPLTPSLLGRLKGFDAIHLHYPFIFGGELAFLASRVWDIPLVVTYHNRLEYVRGPRKVLFAGYNRVWERRILDRAAARIAVSHDHAEQSGYREMTWQEVPNGVDPDFFHPLGRNVARQSLRVGHDEPVILFVGALDAAHWFKNIEGLIDVVAGLPAPVQLWVVGDGDRRRAFENYAARKGAHTRVKFWGHCRLEDLPSFYNAADITVLPSVGIESFGVVLIESMACGTPVVATALGGVRTVISHGQDGLLVAPGSLRDLSLALASLLALDPLDLREMGMRGRRKVLIQYAWDNVGDRLSEIMEAATSRHSNAKRRVIVV